ncbi:hypothetical protein LMG24238_04978 [Paraburkholderia sediminicola]|uniref:Uncharacterized protein n=1 Tax=Paraburkholderia sediminicola TaxID=458836 RepID=A0A6J5C197_9BURK|nr:hypothetical protein [Paraburkholderia sediminicola]CAB3721882.1 hypothetical protein LMG24238_04978 [Paraburkholderia sediminicola]
MWLTNWELGNDPVAPPPMLTGIKAEAGVFVPDMCVECYMAWKAEPVGKLFGSELSAIVPAWGETTELMLSDQAQVPYPVLVPDLTSSAKRATLYSSLFKGGSGDGGIVKCGGRSLMRASAMLSMKTTEMNAVSWPGQEGSETGPYAWRTLLTDINNAGGIDA